MPDIESKTTTVDEMKDKNIHPKMIVTKITEVFVILIQDRHADTDAEIWLNKEEAIARAKELALEYCHYKEDYEEMAEPLPADWVFHATYSCESDHVMVMRKEIQ